MKSKLFAVVVLLAAVCFGYQCAWSQVDTGSISGTVEDSTGAVIPGASVTVTSAATGVEKTVQSGSEGQYLVQGLTPGFYDVTVTSGNFAAFTSRAEVTVGGKVTVDAKLSVTTQTTTVEVVGEGGAAVNTQTQELSQLVDTTQMSQLPSLNRNPYDFVALSGNVSNGDITSNGGAPNPATTVGQSITGYGVGFSINGQRETGTEILLDGVENVGVFSDTAGQPVPADSIREFSIITNNFGPEYGRASGGIVNVGSKSGTNDIHADAFEYNRLSAYTANTFETSRMMSRKARTCVTNLDTMRAPRSLRTSFSRFSPSSLYAYAATRSRRRKSSIRVHHLAALEHAELFSELALALTFFRHGNVPQASWRRKRDFGEPLPLINGIDGRFTFAAGI